MNMNFTNPVNDCERPVGENPRRTIKVGCKYYENWTGTYRSKEAIL